MQIAVNEVRKRSDPRLHQDQTPARNQDALGLSQKHYALRDRKGSVCASATASTQGDHTRSVEISPGSAGLKKPGPPPTSMETPSGFRNASSREKNSS